MIEADVIRQAQAGDREAAAALLRQLETPVYRTAYYLTGNEQDALDCTQEALLKIYRSLPTFKGESGIHTWAQRIVTNVCMDLFRKRRKIVPIGENQWREDERAGREVERGAVAHDLKRAINRLSSPQKTAVIMRYVQDFSYQEIAEAMDLPVGTVKSHLFRARKLLKEWLSEYREGEMAAWRMRK
ncbi:RNA polymerase sigma factor [Staphylospora marina]|uniref:RNA polymerase sigma factor n=1 Tax=Staphylospora marina TaxID=2490858 RepID=UPI000F5BBEA2|nr:sigma-70 family RNA polymerase sigma factor [Staphylospora marina]